MRRLAVTQTPVKNHQLKLSRSKMIIKSKDEVDRMYVSRKEGGRFITATKNNTENTSINGTKNNQKTNIRRKITVWIFQATN